MRKLFKQQLETNEPVTEQILSELKHKKYYSGKNIKIGDVVLFAMLNKGIVSDSTLGIELITLNENEFELYCIDEYANYWNWKELPVVKLNNPDSIGEKISEASKTFFAEDKNLINDDESHYIAFNNKNLEVFIMNMECEVKYNSDGILTETYKENLENVFELFKHENLHISYLPILKFKTKTYGIDFRDILTLDEIKSALESNKVVIIYVALNNSLDKFRAIVIE